MDDNQAAVALPTNPLSAAAKLLSGPYAEQLQSVLGSRDLELEFLAASWGRQHALLTVLDMGGEDLKDRELGRAFERLSARALLASRAVTGCPPGMLSTFDKLAAERPRRRGAYAALAKILAAGGVGAKTLRHAPWLRFADILRLDDLPDWLRVDSMRFCERALAQQLSAIGQALLDQGALSAPSDFTRLLSSNEFVLRPLKSLARRGILFRFPPPPCESGGELRWLGDTAALDEVGKAFANCIADEAQACLAGTKHFYLLEGEEPAVAEITLNGPSWVCSEVRSRRNKPAGQDVEDRIHRLLDLAQVNSRLWRLRIDVRRSSPACR